MAINYKDFSNDSKPYHKYVVAGDRIEECRKVVVHTFSISDVDDPEIYAAQPLYEWEHSEKGQWVMKNSSETPQWHQMHDPVTMGYRFAITAKFTGPKLTEWLLRYGK